jgi:hypothetical protein
MMIRLTACLLLAVVAAAVAGCSTYVNIPAQTGDVAGNDPNVSDVVAIQARALKAVIEDRPAAGKHRFELIAGSNAESYAKAAKELGDLAQPVGAGADNTMPPLEVRQVLIRGWSGQVDIARSSDPANPAAPKQLVTAYMKLGAFDGWMATRLYTWRIPVEEAVKKSRLELETEGPKSATPAPEPKSY